MAVPRRLIWIVAAVIALILSAALLGPFLISTEPSPGSGSPDSSEIAGVGFVRVAFPGTAGVDLHYLDAGVERRTDSANYILLHGFTFNAFTWNPVLEYFGRQGRVFAYDQIPYGLSSKLTPADWSGPNPYSKEAAIAQLFAFMDSVGIEKATLVGSSSGGTLALEAALAEPERVERLILVAPWVYAQRPTIPASFAELPQLRRLSLLVARKLGKGVLLDYSYAHPEVINQERRNLMSIHERMPGWDIAWGELLNRSLSSPVEVSRRLGEITQPVLMLTGDTDKLVPVDDTRRAAEALANATLKILSDCGHVPQEECPEQLERAITEWIEDQSVATSP